MGRPRWLVCAGLAAAAVACSGGDREVAPVAAPPRVQASLVEVRSIGRSPSAPAEELFHQIRGIRTDRAGRIYVADQGPMSVRTFSPEGRFLRAFGGRGQQPGRLLDITSFHVTAEGGVLVLDGALERISRFSPDGRFLAAEPMNPQRMLWPRDLRPLDEKRFLAAFSLPDEEADDRWLHVFDASLQRELASFGPAAAGSGEEAHFAGLFGRVYPARVWVESPRSVLVAPILYRGEAFRYEEEGGAWKLAQVFQGYSPGSPFELVDPDGAQNRRYFFAMTHRRGRLAAEIYNASVGLFRLRDGRIVHFTSLRDETGEGRVFGVEVYRPDGTLQGYAPFERFDAHRGESALFPVTVEWKDDNDLFYLRETGEQPVVRVVRLDGGNAVP